MSTNKIKTIEDLINHLGGHEEVANIFNLSTRSIQRWITKEVPIHRKHYKIFQKQLKISRLELVTLLKSLK